MSFISIGTSTAFLTFMNNSGEPLKRNGCVKTDNAVAPPFIICFAISIGLDTFLISPNAGDENFTSVISAACVEFLICSLRSIFDGFNELDML